MAYTDVKMSSLIRNIGGFQIMCQIIMSSKVTYVLHGYVSCAGFYTDGKINVGGRDRNSLMLQVNGLNCAVY